MLNEFSLKVSNNLKECKEVNNIVNFLKILKKIIKSYKFKI